jgi:hypothetical protein
MLTCSDIITFHNYCTSENLERTIKEFQEQYKRPVILQNTWLKSIKTILKFVCPFLRSIELGQLTGVSFKETNTIYACDEPIPVGDEPQLWFHDIFRADGSSYE